MNAAPSDIGNAEHAIDLNAWSRNFLSWRMLLKACLSGIVLTACSWILWVSVYAQMDDPSLRTSEFPYYRLRYFPLELILTFVVVTPVMYLGMWAKARKTLAFADWCHKHGWSYARRLFNPLMTAGFNNPEQVHAVRMGRFGSKHRDFFWKDFNGRKVIMNRFDIPCGEDSSRPGVRIIVETGARAPEIDFRPKSITDLGSIHVGEIQPIRFELDVFNRQWLVKTDDPKKTYDIFDQSTIEFLLNTSEPPHVHVNEGILIAYLDGKGIHKRVRLMEFVDGFSDAVPDDLILPIELIDD